MEIPIEAAMLYRYSCRDMGLSCPFVVKGETLDEVAEKALQHVQSEHRTDFNTFRTREEIEAMKKALTRSTRVVPG